MDTELKAYLDALKADVSAMKTDLAAIKLALLERTDVIDTGAPSEFWNWARTADARYRQSQAVACVMDERLRTVEDQLAEFERRKAS